MATVYVNGNFVPKEEAMINVYDHGLLYGDGVFEGIRCYNNKVFRLKDHLDRLYDSAQCIYLSIPVEKEKMSSIVEETVKRSGLKDSYIRLVVTRGVGNLGLNPIGTSPSVICIVDGISLYPQKMYEEGMSVIVSSVTRNHINCISPRVKSLNYLNNILAKLEAINAGCNEAIMLNSQGYVAECSADNIFVCKGGIVRTPPLSAGPLAGITRDTVIELARSNGYTLLEENLTTYDLYTADEIFLTGSAAEMIPITKIDLRIIGTGKAGPIFKDLSKKYHDYVRR